MAAAIYLELRVRRPSSEGVNLLIAVSRQSVFDTIRRPIYIHERSGRQ
jgi:hypothetical protein